MLALLLLTWILDFNGGKKFGVHCADVAGAFDRVRTERLLEKLEHRVKQTITKTMFA